MADESITEAYAWVPDGCPTIFVTNEGLDTAWAVAAGFVDTHAGLVDPTGLVAAVNLRKLYPETTFATIKVNDIDGTLAALFGANRYDAADLVTTLEAGVYADVPAGASLYDKHVGLEAIGSTGQRHLYPFVPGYAIGSRHLGQNAAVANGSSPAPVSDTPVLWDGRRCAVYRVKYVAGAWQSLANAKRVWWGTMRGKGVHHMRQWSFKCFGPDSLLDGSLGTGNFEDGLRVVPEVSLVEAGLAGEAVIRCQLSVYQIDDTPNAAGRHDYLTVFDGAANDVDNLLSGVTTYAGVAAALNSFFDVIVSDTTNGLAFDNNADGNDIRYDTSDGLDGIVIRWRAGDDTTLGDPYVDVDDADWEHSVCALYLMLHEKVWRALGYDVRQQNDVERDAIEHQDSYGRFEWVGFADGYWAGTFTSAAPNVEHARQTGEWGGDIKVDDYSSGGGDRRWPPLYLGGAISFDGQPGQEFQAITADEVRLAGSTSRPLMADLDDNSTAYSIGSSVGTITSQGLMVFEGPYRRRGDKDQNEAPAGYAFGISREREEGWTVQVARVCWKDASGLVSTDSDAMPRFVIYEWLEPRLYGFDYEKIDGSWGGFRNPPPDSEPITMRPLTVWEYSDEGDRVSTVLQRILLTTGTAALWYAEVGLSTQIYGLGADAAFQDVGDNDTGGTIPKDAEVASMGLGIPAALVDSAANFAAVDLVVGTHLARCKAVSYGVAPAAQLIEKLLAPTGLAIGFRGGKYSLIDAWTFPNPDDATVINTEWYAGKEGGRPGAVIPKQKIGGKFGPISELKIRARAEPLDGGYERELSRASSDMGLASRAQHVKHQVLGDHMLSTRLAGVTGSDWEADLIPRWRQGFEYWAAAHSTITVPLHLEDAVDLWPGDGVLFSDSWQLDTTGSYGISGAVGVVLSRTIDCAAKTNTVEILLAAETEYRMWAPTAVVTQYDDADPYKLICQDDHFGDRGGASFDVDGFAEPSYSTEGGNALVELWQFDGSPNGPNSATGGWVGGIYGVVSSVNGATSDSYITLTGALTGATFYTDRHTIVTIRDFANQTAAWPVRWYAPICDPDGTHDPASTVGSKWRGV